MIQQQQEGRLGPGLLQLWPGAGDGLCQKPRDVSLGPDQGGPGHPTRADLQQRPEGGAEPGREAPDLGGVLADARRRRDHRPEHLRPGLPPAHLPRQQGVRRHLLLPIREAEQQRTQDIQEEIDLGQIPVVYGLNKQKNIFIKIKV